MTGKKTKKAQRDNLAQAARDAGPIATLDLKVAKALEPYCDNKVVEVLGEASELADQPPLIAASALTLAAGVVLGKPRLARTGVRMLAAHAVATLLKTLVKNRVDRTRPSKVAKDGEHEITRGDSDDGEKRSFPSGHSAGALAVARAIARETPGAAAVAYPIAAVAAGVQLPRKAHFLSDVVAGAAIGLVAEWMVSRLLRKS